MCNHCPQKILGAANVDLGLVNSCEAQVNQTQVNICPQNFCQACVRHMNKVSPEEINLIFGLPLDSLEFCTLYGGGGRSPTPILGICPVPISFTVTVTAPVTFDTTLKLMSLSQLMSLSLSLSIYHCDMCVSDMSLHSLLLSLPPMHMSMSTPSPQLRQSTPCKNKHIIGPAHRKQNPLNR